MRTDSVQSSDSIRVILAKGFYAESWTCQRQTKSAHRHRSAHYARSPRLRTDPNFSTKKKTQRKVETIYVYNPRFNRRLAIVNLDELNGKRKLKQKLYHHQKPCLWKYFNLQPGRGSKLSSLVCRKVIILELIPIAMPEFAYSLVNRLQFDWNSLEEFNWNSFGHGDFARKL